MQEAHTIIFVFEICREGVHLVLKLRQSLFHVLDLLPSGSV
jgi:hypothetical protein